MHENDNFSQIFHISNVHAYLPTKMNSPRTALAMTIKTSENTGDSEIRKFSVPFPVFK